MNKKHKRSTYKHLTRTFGSPVTMSGKMKTELLILLGGWLTESKGKRDRGWYYNSSLPRRMTDTPENPKVFERHAQRAREGSRAPVSHWNIRRFVRTPASSKGLQKIFGLPARDTYGYADPGLPWDWLRKESGKDLTIMIPVNYHITVAPHGIQLDGRKIVQRVWNHRVYTDKEIWQCAYWDFSKLTKDESSWSRASYHEGYVVKTAICVAVDVDFSKAVALALRRTVMAGVKSILRDADGEG